MEYSYIKNTYNQSNADIAEVLRVDVEDRSQVPTYVLIPGSGSHYINERPIATALFNAQNCNVVNMSPRSRGENGVDCTLYDTAEELAIVLLQSADAGLRNFSLTATSQGMVAIALLYDALKNLCRTDVLEHIQSIILMDPADYLLSEIDKYESEDPGTWDGSRSEEYRLIDDEELISNKIKWLKIYPSINVNLVFFELKNRNQKGYVHELPEHRGKNDGIYTRLASSITKRLSTQLGVDVIKSINLPHAINRDGNPTQNQLLYAQFILTLSDSKV